MVNFIRSGGEFSVGQKMQNSQYALFPLLLLTSPSTRFFFIQVGGEEQQYSIVHQIRGDSALAAHHFFSYANWMALSMWPVHERNGIVVSPI